MTYSIQILSVLTIALSTTSDTEQLVDEVLLKHKPQLVECLLKFLSSEITPASTMEFEKELQTLIRELGRTVVESTLNRIEPDNAAEVSHDVYFESGGYRRLNAKTPNRFVSTLFGSITLWRFPFRYWHRDCAEPCVFPLELQLGLIHGATPATAEAASHYAGESGSTQRSTLTRLREVHSLRWGPERLRDVISSVADAMEECRCEFQVLRLLEMLQIASESRGKCKPVISVGRDGVMLRKLQSFREHVSTGTISIYDRSGHRVGTVYIAAVPESGQGWLTKELTAIIKKVLTKCSTHPHASNNPTKRNAEHGMSLLCEYSNHSTSVYPGSTIPPLKPT